MIVIVHQTEGMYLSAKHFSDLAQEFEIAPAVPIVSKDGLAPCPPIHDMVTSAFEFNAQGARHVVMATL